MLVTGASGFIGSALARRLDAAGVEVRAFDARHGDVANLRPGDSVDHVFHLAGKSFVPDSWTDPVSFYRTNVVGAASVLEYARHCGARVTLVSSYVYGRPAFTPTPEHHPRVALNPYAHTKILAEDVATFYRERFGVAVTVVRPFNVYGPGQKPPFLVPSIIAQALDPSAEEIRIENPAPRRDYLFVEDLVDLLLKTVGAEADDYNAGSGESIGVGDLAALIAELAQSRKPVRESGVRREGEIPDVVADISKADRQLGWRPSTRLRAGLLRTIQAARASTS